MVEMEDESEDTLEWRLRIRKLEHAVAAVSQRLDELEKTVGDIELEIRQINEAEDIGVTQ